MYSICFFDLVDFVFFFVMVIVWNKFFYNIFFVVIIKFVFGINVVYLFRKNRRKVKDLEMR